MSGDVQSANNGFSVTQQVEPICITAPTVSGLGETEVLERIVLDLAELAEAGNAAGILSLATLVALEVVALSKRISITECEVFTNKVLINGVLHKDLLFKFAAETQPLATDISLTPGDCSFILAETLDLVIDCPFGACISVPGACPGDTCLVENACVEAEKELLVDINGDGIPDQFEEKVCILLQVKTIRNQQVTITPATVNICPSFTPLPACPPGPCPSQTSLPSSVFINRQTGTFRG